MLTESITTTTATPTQTTTETVPTTPATTVTTSTTLETTSTTTATPTTTASTLKTIYKLYFRRENLSTLMVAEQAYSCTGSLIGRAQHTSVKRCALSCLKNMHCICMCYNDRLCSIYGDWLWCANQSSFPIFGFSVRAGEAEKILIWLLIRYTNTNTNTCLFWGRSFVLGRKNEVTILLVFCCLIVLNETFWTLSKN